MRKAERDETMAYKIIEKDPWLAPFASDIALREALLSKKKKGDYFETGPSNYYIVPFAGCVRNHSKSLYDQMARQILETMHCWVCAELIRYGGIHSVAWLGNAQYSDDLPVLHILVCVIW